MKIQQNISATMKRKLRECKNQTEFAEMLGIGRTSCQDYLAGRGNPSANTIQQMADRMDVTLGQLVSGEDGPIESAFDLINGMLDRLHPSLYEAGAALLESLQNVFLLSEQRFADSMNWRYSVTEPHPFQYGLMAETRTGQGWIFAAESDPFTDDHAIAQAAAELFTRNALSPIHMADAIEDYMGSI